MPDNTSPLEGEIISLDQASEGLLSGIADEVPETPAETSDPDAAPETEEVEEEPSADDETTDEDTEEAEPEEEDLPAIDPPASWKQADREYFAELPRNLQITTAERERSREVATNKAFQEAAEIRKTADAQIQAATDERQKYQQQLDYIVPALQQGMAGEFSDIRTSADVLKLASEEPDRYALWRANQDALQIAQAEQSKVQQQQRIEAETARANYLDEAGKRLEAAFPEWKDQDKGRREIEETQKYLADNYGLDSKLLTQMTEPYQYQIARKAMAYDKAQRAKAKAVQKKVPKVQKPGSPQSKAEKAAEGRTAKLDRLGQTGDINDALAVLME